LIGSKFYIFVCPTGINRFGEVNVARVIPIWITNPNLPQTGPSLVDDQIIGKAINAIKQGIVTSWQDFNRVRWIAHRGAQKPKILGAIIRSDVEVIAVVIDKVFNLRTTWIDHLPFGKRSCRWEIMHFSAVVAITGEQQVRTGATSPQAEMETLIGLFVDQDIIGR
jgi:hypothetical protein